MRRWMGGVAVAWMLGCGSSPKEPLAHARAEVVLAFGGMTQARSGPACAALADGRVLAAGGNPGASTAELFDPITRGWTATGSMASSHVDAAVARLADGRVLVAGGVDLSGEVRTSVEIYDPVHRTFASVAPLGTPRTKATATTLVDGRVLVVGGFTVGPTEGSPASSTEIYEPSADRWSAGPSMSAFRAEHAAARLPDGRVLVVGSTFATTAEVFSANATSVVQTGPVVRTRYRPALAILGDGRALVAGGLDGAKLPLASTELWDPASTSAAWLAGPTMAAPRRGPFLIPLATGAWVAYGGCGLSATCAVERVDAHGLAWTTLGDSLARHDDFFCAAPIPGGVLVAGGEYGDWTAEGWIGAAGGEACTASDDCASGACAGGKCAPAVVDAGADVAPPIDGAPPPAVSDFARCQRDADCATGHCADGVCCDTACRETCHSCALFGSIGRCALAPAGVDLRGECGAAATCTGTCNGAGACVGATSGTQCAPARCTSTSAGVGPAYCAAAGARCPSEGAISFDCSPYVCEPVFGACRDGCASSSDCAGGYICDVPNKICVAPPASGGDDGGCAIGPLDAAARAAPWLLGVLVASAIARRRARPRR